MHPASKNFADAGSPRGAENGIAHVKRHRRFENPAVIQAGRIDRDRVTWSTKIALKVLEVDWPQKKCPKRRRAMESCLQVLRGETPPSIARRAIVAAAREARVCLRS